MHDGVGRAARSGVPRPSHVEIAGRVDDARLAQLYREAPCVVAPAYEEDYGLTAIEAMRFGTPVVVCRDGGGLAGIVRHGFDGLVVEPDASVDRRRRPPDRSDDGLRDDARPRARWPPRPRSPGAGRRPAPGRPRSRLWDDAPVKIGIVAPSPVPPTRGGAERAWAGLARAIDELTPHEAELVKLPVRETTLPELLEGYRAFARLDVSRFDRVITSKYPAWIVAHPYHIVWMFHPLRGLYDTYHMFGMPERAEPTVAEVARPGRGSSTGRRCAASSTAASTLWDRALRAAGPDHPELALPSPVARRLVHWLDAVALAPPAVRRHPPSPRPSRPAPATSRRAPTRSWPTRPSDLPGPDRLRVLATSSRPAGSTARSGSTC